MTRFFLAAVGTLLAILLFIPRGDEARAQYFQGYVANYAVPINYFDGNFHWHNSGPDEAGRQYPAGNYAWLKGNWYLQGSGYVYKATVAEALAAKPVDYTPGWQKKLLDIAAQRDKTESKLRLQAMDYNAFQQSLKALGLEGNFRWNGYGQAINYGTGFAHSYGQGSVNLGSYGGNGNTLYGYSYSTIKDVYGDTNLNTLYQQAARLTQNAQTLAGQATTDFTDLVGKEGENRARVAEILAQAQAASQALQAAKPQARERTETRVFSFRTEADGNGGVKVVPIEGGGEQPIAQPRDAAVFQTLIKTKCASCHSGDKKEGGFDIATYGGLDALKKTKVWNRLLTPDQDKRMPKGQPALTADEIRLFVTN